MLLVKISRAWLVQFLAGKSSGKSRQVNIKNVYSPCNEGTKRVAEKGVWNEQLSDKEEKKNGASKRRHYSPLVLVKQENGMKP